MKKYIIISLLIYTVNIQAQQSLIDDSSFLDRTEFKVGYYGNLLWDNGINLGAEYTWREKKKVKETKKGQKTVTHQFLFNGSIGYSTNFANKTDNGLHTYYGLIWRRTSPRRWQLHVSLNPLGYYRSFLPETYEVKGGNVEKVFLPGRGYYNPTLSVGIGRQRKGKTRSGSYFNITFSPRFNYNAGTFPTLFLQYGFRFNFKNKKQ